MSDGEQQNEKYQELVEATSEILRQPLRDTITVVETVYHQPAGEEPTALSSQWTRPLETQEQPYTREIKVGEQWQPLDTGWVERPGMIRVVNREGRFFQTNPTPEERAAVAARVIAIRGSFNEDPWLVAPGESFRGVHTNPKDLQLYCRSGTAKATVTVYPA